MIRLETTNPTEFAFGKGFNQDMVEISKRLNLPESITAEIDIITKAGINSLDKETVEKWGAEKTRAIFKVFVTASNEAEPEVNIAWANPYPETEEEIKAQIYLFGLMKSIYSFIYALRPSIVGNTDILVVMSKTTVPISADIFYPGKISAYNARRTGLEARSQALKTQITYGDDTYKRVAETMGPSNAHLN